MIIFVRELMTYSILQWAEPLSESLINYCNSGARVDFGTRKLPSV